MSYKLYTDKNENFECEVSVKNASLKGSIARLIVESEGVNLVFNGKIEGEKCVIPVKKLKGLLDENVRGKMHLEVIVEDTYFKPWESDFTVEEHTSVKVKVNEEKHDTTKPVVSVVLKKPVVKEIKAPKPAPKKPSPPRKGINVYIPMKEIMNLCEQFDIHKDNFQKKKGDFVQLLKEYFKANPEYNYHKQTILRGIDSFLK